MARPDIASPVRAVTRHVNNPATRHPKVVCRVNAYLKVTEDLSVVFWWGGELKLSSFIIEAYPDRCNNRRSVSGDERISVSVSSTTEHSVSYFINECSRLCGNGSWNKDYLSNQGVFSHISVASTLTCMRIAKGQRRLGTKNKREITHEQKSLQQHAQLEGQRIRESGPMLFSMVVLVCFRFIRTSSPEHVGWLWGHVLNNIFCIFTVGINTAS